ncbi:MAG: hypothetical protein HZA91_04680, partial [Verrucomicrobia bacterium]|nr:hypothetical protein [Verrucomicrobiota bacterium]
GRYPQFTSAKLFTRSHGLNSRTGVRCCGMVRIVFFLAIGSYRQFFGRYLSCSVEGGMNVQRGEGYDRDLTLARAAVDFFMGKLTLQLGYQFTDETFLGDMREKQFFYFRGKRTF